MEEFFGKYGAQTSRRVKVIDAFCIFLLLLTIVPFGYCALVGNFPMNSLLASIFAPLGTLIFTVCLRLHVHKEDAKHEKEKEDDFKPVTEGKAFWEYLFCFVTFYIAIINFLGWIHIMVVINP